MLFLLLFSITFSLCLSTYPFLSLSLCLSLCLSCKESKGLRLLILCLIQHCLACVQYAQDTQHEKILRGLAVGISLTMYGRLEEADALVESLMRDKDPILRWAGMYTLAMAYCGSGNNQAIRRLLHVAVSVCVCVCVCVSVVCVVCV